MKPLHLYIHFPFCRTKCRYCDFVSYPFGSYEDYVQYLFLVKQELVQKIEAFSLASAELTTVYFGGGTPSLVKAEEWHSLLQFLSQFFRFSSSLEITLEVNPGTVKKEDLIDFQQVGITRLSIGVQSTRGEMLRFLNRPYSINQVEKILEEVRMLNFSSWNADLLYSLPFQFKQDWEEELKRLLIFDPPHLSIYNLTLSLPASLYSFQKYHPLAFPSSDSEADWFYWTMQFLGSKGYRQYEISNFARPGAECKHNQAYWTSQDYLGLGVAAWSYLGGERHKNTDWLKNYISKINNKVLPIVFREKLSAKERLQEEIMLSLRTIKGVSISDIAYRYPDFDLNYLQEKLLFFTNEGFLLTDGDRFWFSPSGILLANQILSEVVD
ncbi:MAG: hypothetical protein PWP04_1630 [Candidatus Atribacteria bacterium]|nr:hypothetical protein [Candidatus Atribacteria bacterium]